MKIAVCGKGGVGKTFIAGSLARCLVQAGHPVLAIDADSSPNLALTLGLTSGDAARIVPVAENEELIRLKTATEYPGVFRLTFTVDDIIRNHAVLTPSGVHLLVMGTIRAMGSGCTCPAHSVVKALMRHLVVERNEAVILDMEAGIEHLGRGTAGHVNSLLVVTDANRKSLEVAATICRLARESEIAHVGLVGNRVDESRHETAIRSFADEHGLDVIAIIPYDMQVTETGISGNALDESSSVAFQVIRELSSRLIRDGE
ncbi:AAA family ATPase [uncultured Methanoregula sp.]|uniref:ATP-binding protein n=1 Tax=uncultured Methanoregula sp. TaxID=1005933 RepID=UPI002AAAFCB9|nr:AAA family ATPase [uncultured Methanoregula sp.]